MPASRQFPVYVIEQLAGTVNAARNAKILEFRKWEGQSPISKRFHNKPGRARNPYNSGRPGSLYYPHPMRPKQSIFTRSSFFRDVCQVLRNRSEASDPLPRFATLDRMLDELFPIVNPHLVSHGYPDRWDTSWSLEEVEHRMPEDYRLGDRGASCIDAVEQMWEDGDVHELYDLQLDAKKAEREFDRMLGELKRIGFSPKVLFPLMAHFRSVPSVEDIPPAPQGEAEMLDLYWEIMQENHLTNPHLHRPVNAYLTKRWVDRGLKLPTS